MHTLHERNMQSAINEKTAAMKVQLETLNQDNVRLNQELQSSKTDYVKIIFAFILALIIGFILTKILLVDQLPYLFSHRTSPCVIKSP
jgi:hypothetical protein